MNVLEAIGQMIGLLRELVKQFASNGWIVILTKTVRNELGR